MTAMEASSTSSHDLSCPRIVTGYIGKDRRCLVWDQSDLAILRSSYRIMGALIGASGSMTAARRLVGLPLALCSEEVTLLLSKGWIRLVKDVESRYGTPSQSDIDAYNDELIALGDAQWTASKDLHIEKIKIEKSLRRHMASVGKDGKDTTNEDVGTLDEELSEVDEERLKSLRKGFVVLGRSAVSAKAFRPPRPLHNREVDWCFPMTLIEWLRMRVFRDLWEKGFFMTSGMKFGGDYLVYPGDPSRFHSQYIAVVIPWTQRIPPVQLLSLGRLAHSVRKTLLLCSASEDVNGDIRYQSIQWCGM